MTKIYIFVVFVGCLAFARAEFKSKPLPSYISPCKRDNPNAGDCSKKSAIAAIPILLKGDKTYKISNLLPLKVPKVELNSGENLQLTLTDISVFGLEALDLQKFSIDPVKKHVETSFNLNWLNVDSKYTIKGQILVLPISGSGPANMTFYDVALTYILDYNLIKKDDGKEYINVLKSNIDVKIPKAFFHLENLFNGNKELGDHMNNFLNENSAQVVKDLGIPVIEELIEVVVTQVFTNILHVVPYDEVLIK